MKKFDWVTRFEEASGCMVKVKTTNTSDEIVALINDGGFDLVTASVDAFALKKGVCQDYSQIMIACLRSIGVPAGYFSGLLRTTSPVGKPRLEGAVAMHAWVMEWCGTEVSWVEYDPTNNQFVGDEYILIARGRDYADVAPIRGVMRLSGSQSCSQAVDVIPSEECSSVNSAESS